MATPKVGLSRPFIVSRVVYGTITLMSVLIVYDGWAQLRFRDVVVVIVGPVLAMFLAHMFAATLARQVELGRAVTRAERATIVRSESRFLLLAVPPVVVVGILTLLGLSVSASIRCLVVLGAISLGCWGGVAGRRSGMTGWRLVLAVAAGLVIGALVLGLDVFLQPGKAFAATVA
jgi:VanZ family protein